MHTMNLRPAFCYRIKENVRSTALFFLIIALITLALAFFFSVSISGETSIQYSFSYYETAAIIYLFVCGIVIVREDLRLFLQYGVSRRTAFAADLLAAFLTALALSMFATLLTLLMHGLFGSNPQVTYLNLYQIIFFGGSVSPLSFSQHLCSIAVLTAVQLAAYMTGEFLSLLFYRLNKILTIFVAVALGLFLTTGLPILTFQLRSLLAPIGAYLVANVWRTVLFFLVCAFLTGIIDWLLLRRAPVRAHRSK